jgi:hypothetical protein
VIVVIGQPVPHPSPGGTVAGGAAAAAALAAAAAGSTVQLVARVTDDPDGDAMLLHLAGAGVSHVATLRQPATAGDAKLEAADLDLALRYLGEVAVLVLAPSEPGLAAVAAEAASWSRAALIVMLPHGAPVPDDLPADATVLGSPAADPDGAFGTVVGAYAAALDRGVDAATAFRTTIDAGGWSAVGD